jgi:hypothetical protein
MKKLPAADEKYTEKIQEGNNNTDLHYHIANHLWLRSQILYYKYYLGFNLKNVHGKN